MLGFTLQSRNRAFQQSEQSKLGVAREQQIQILHPSRNDANRSLNTMEKFLSSITYISSECEKQMY